MVIYNGNRISKQDNIIDLTVLKSLKTYFSEIYVRALEEALINNVSSTSPCSSLIENCKGQISDILLLRAVIKDDIDIYIRSSPSLVVLYDKLLKKGYQFVVLKERGFTLSCCDRDQIYIPPVMNIKIEKFINQYSSMFFKQFYENIPNSTVFFITPKEKQEQVKNIIKKISIDKYDFMRFIITEDLFWEVF